MTDPTILITGVSGFLGLALARFASEYYPIFGLYCTDNPVLTLANIPVKKVDVRDAEGLKETISRIRPTVVIHCAAFTGLDRCVSNPNLCREINVLGTDNVAQACKEIGAKMVFVSSDAVFSGEEGNYDEEDIPAPRSTYGKAKYEAEGIVSSICKDYCICRAALIYGVGNGTRHCHTERMIESLRRGESVNLFEDEYKSMIYLPNICEKLLGLACSDFTGTYHLGGPERISRYEFGCRIAEVFGFDSQKIIPISSQDFPSLEPRARDVSLNCSKVSRDLRILNQLLEVSLSEFYLNFEQLQKLNTDIP